MKFVKSIAGLFVLSIMLYSCSDDDNNTNQPSMKTASVTLKARSSLNSGTGRTALFTGNVDVDQFWVNLQNIEFEYAEGMDIPSEDTPDTDDDVLTINELPNPIQTYLNENYPDDPFCDAEMEDDGRYQYEVELASGREIYFKSDFSVLAVEEGDEPCQADAEDENGWGSEDEVELAGPFELNLSNGAATIVEVQIPAGTYEGVEFEIGANTVPGNELYQKSILVTGTISGTPFKFYNTFEEDFEIDYEDTGQNLVVGNSGQTTVVFDFNLQTAFNSVNLGSAADLDGNGTIEISQIGPDGNHALAAQIINAIEQYAELQEED